MLRSLYSGISGMKVNQTKMDVIGNNIANVGTTAFKAGRARFADMLSQNVTEAQAPMANQGGVNASQVGLGVQLASIDTIMTQGSMEPTSRNLDVAIDGEGFFMVSKGPAVFGDGTLQVNQQAGSHNISSQSLSNASTDLMYTREGSFSLDNDGNLLTSDGYRVMGYALTNDTTTKSATSQEPNQISAGGFDFQFGPGSLLNGYKVELGEVGPDTVASASVDKNNKIIYLNGDFSKDGGITKDQAQTAISKALDTAGIAQSVQVKGTSTVINNIETDKVSGGADASKPSSISVGGFTVQFGAGSALNGYSIQLGSIGSGTTPSASVDETNKVITLNVDMISGTVQGSQVKDALTAAFAIAAPTQITQTVDSVTGNAMNLSQSSGTISGSTATTAASNVSVGGFTFSFNAGAGLEGYSIQLGNINAAATTTSVDNINKKIIINGNFLTPGSVTASAIQTSLATTLGANAPLLNSVSGAEYTYTGVTSSTSNGGTDLKAPSQLSAMGFKFDFTAGAALNGYDIEIGNISAGTTTSASVDTTNKKIIINGDFVTPNGTSASLIMNAINTALAAKDFTQAVKVTGTPITINNTASNVADGGTPVESLDPNGELNFVDATKTVNAYDGSLKTLRIPDKVKMPGEDTALRVTSFSISKDGIISAVLEDGRVAALGQIAMASFKNPAGLEKLGKNLYHASVNSGTATLKSGINTTGEDNSKGYGDMEQGMLEMSNVDLADQFTEMITTSRAFQASSKLITTGDELLQDIIDLKR